jgi:hypothetical protein
VCRCHDDGSWAVVDDRLPGLLVAHNLGLVLVEEDLPSAEPGVQRAEDATMIQKARRRGPADGTHSDKYAAKPRQPLPRPPETYEP